MKEHAMARRASLTDGGASKGKTTTPAGHDGSEDAVGENQEHAEVAREPDERRAWIASRWQPSREGGSPAVGPFPAPLRRGAPAESTDLERRVLAHEQILQTLIAHMTEAEPRFMERLQRTFSEPMRMSRSEHDYTDTASYAERFIREVARLGESVGVADGERPQPANPRPPAADALGEPAARGATYFQVTHRSGIWQVSKNGAFYGHYSGEKPAIDAARAAVDAIVASGGSAERSSVG
jgi:AcrR family transcriptional regulator